MRNKFICFLASILFLVNGQVLASLVDNADGTVIDTETGLMWQKCNIGQTYNGGTGGCDGSAVGYDWQNALDQSESLTLAGYDDWRLPNRNELQSLVDYSQYDSSIDPLLKPYTLSFYYWSSTTDAGYTNKAWLVFFYDGYTSSESKSDGSYVRAVRLGRSGLLPSVLSPILNLLLLND